MEHKLDILNVHVCYNILYITFFLYSFLSKYMIYNMLSSNWTYRKTDENSMHLPEVIKSEIIKRN
jgi:hypothetical protein